jgi:hypothetical protein
LSQALGGEPGQDEVGDFAPSVIEDKRVAAVGECVIQAAWPWGALLLGRARPAVCGAVA